MRSIRTQILILTLTAVFVSILAIGTVSIASVREEGIRQAESEMVMLCDNHRKTLNQYFSSIEQSVGTVSRFAMDTLDSAQMVESGVTGSDGYPETTEERIRNSAAQISFDLYLQDYLDEVNTVFGSIANHTSSVISYYYRINPEVSVNAPGFFYLKDDGMAVFEKQELTDPFAYDKDEVQHAGWYYIPLKRGRPSWIYPYYNANVRLKMSSYVTPIYRAGTFIGVLGMDISYETMVSQVRNLHIYDTGYAFLADSEGTVIYHEDLESGTNLSEIDSVFVEQIKELTNQNPDPVLLETQYQGVPKKAACAALSNGLILLVLAPLSEINSQWHELVNRLILISAGIVFIFALLTMVLMRKLTLPLHKLTIAAQNLMHENYDVDLDYDGNNEVGVLTRSFKQMSDHLQVYVKDLNSLAYKDELTGVKNKRAFDIIAQDLDTKIQKGRDTGIFPEYAIAAFDCNDLKVVNDEYGHWKGDEYLRSACQAICHAFASSPVFRMGGDEFTVILMHDDYTNREELMARFHQKTQEHNQSKEFLWERINVAAGMADFDPNRDQSVRETAHRADELMYANKQKMKSGVRTTRSEY